MIRCLIKLCLAVLLTTVLFVPSTSAQLTPMEQLGKFLYFDANLSTPNGMSCATCHDPNAGFADPDVNFPTSQGVIDDRWGNRNSPAAAYAAYSPPFYYDPIAMMYVGGQFWDGRASTLEDQAKGPFLNPLEMANPSKKTVIVDVVNSAYANLFAEMFGANTKTILANIDSAYNLVANAIAAYERTSELNMFTSKYDYYLAGYDVLSTQELRGLSLFEGQANCHLCHISQFGPDGSPPVFSDFTYDNLGVPKNPNNPFYTLPKQFNPDGINWIDYGLGGVLGLQNQMGKFKVMPLRNIAKTPPYTHNGVFQTLDEVVNFYNTRDLGGWPAPEVALNVNITEIGNLGLNSGDVKAVVAFLNTLTDGFVPPAPGLAANNVPSSFALGQNYPNPFNPSTQICFSIPAASHVRLEVFNVIGQKVATLLDAQCEAGDHVIEWDARSGDRPIASGVYFYRLQTSSFETTKKMMLLK